MKLSGYDFYKKIGSPKLILAPMVDASELAWRELGRKYGAQLAYTPMFHSLNFIQDSTYRKNAMEMSPTDRPLIYQFCANDPKVFCEAAKHVENVCDAVDLNLGCPQAIAKRGHYGSFLQDEWDLIKEILSTCVENVKIPVTAKIRIFPTIEKTIQYAKMIESCGVSMLVVHGRLREQKGINTGLADWKVIKAVKDSLSIPVIANGNIQSYEDIIQCMNDTGVDGVMSAEGHLHNPTIFSGPYTSKNSSIYQVSLEYLEYVKKYPCPMSYVRGHLFKLLHHSLHCHPEFREKLGGSRTVSELQHEIESIRDACKGELCAVSNSYIDDLLFPHWICQPYIRPAVKDTITADSSIPEPTFSTAKLASQYQYTSLDAQMQNQRLEERQRRRDAKRICKENKAKKGVFKKHICDVCHVNTKSLKCQYVLCKQCCRLKSESPGYKCDNHKSFKVDSRVTIQS